MQHIPGKTAGYARPHLNEIMDIARYNQCKFVMAQILRTLTALAPRESPASRDQIRHIQTRLAEDRFNLTVVGRFSRGKSSLMNAMLNTDRLPTGMEPLTSVITSVSYGSSERVIVRYQGRRLPHETGIASLPEFVTQHGNPGNEKEVEIAEIQMPAELLRQGFFFVDTPGLGSPVLENSFTTENFLPEIDGLVLVSGFDDPLDEGEMEALDAALAGHRKTFVVLNKRDLVAREEERSIFLQTRRRLSERYRDATPEVFSVSALQAMQGRVANDSLLVSKSGIVAFEQAVTAFLIQSKSLSILQQSERRVEEIVNKHKSISEVPEIRDGLEKIASLIEHSEQGIAAGPDTALGSPNAAWSASPCPICLETRKQTADFLAKYQYELLVWHKVQCEHANAGGFCALHTWQYEAVASPQGVASSYPAVLERIAGKVREIDASQPTVAAEALDALGAAGADCPVCRVARDADREAIRQAAKQANAEPGAVEAEFCLHHAAALVRCLKRPEAVRMLLDRTALLLERTAVDMSQYALKHDGLRRYLASAEENKAYLRGLLMIAGLRSLALPGNAHVGA